MHLKGLFRTSFFLSFFTLSFALSQAAVAGTAVADFYRSHRIESFKLESNADLKVHNFGEYQLAEIFIPAGESNVTVHDLRIKGLAIEAYKKITTPRTLVVVGGGFFGYNSNGKETPIGLTREDNVRKVALMPWSHGGVLTSDGKGTLRIFPAESANQGGRWPYALQSKPIIILNGKVDVAKNLRDANFNRVAVGTTAEGDILIVGLFHGFGQAATLVKFSEIYKRIADRRSLKILRALAMDGGAGAQIHIPSLDMSFGDTGLSYFPNAIRFESNQGSAASR